MRVVVRRAFVTAALSLRIARRMRGSARGACWVGAQGVSGERCDPLTRSGCGSGAWCCGSGPELGWAAGGEHALACDLVLSSERGECLVKLDSARVAVGQVT